MTEIVRCVIYPGIGVARVGNAPSDYYIGPEAPGQVPAPAGGFKDAAGRIKRQAARFRVYGLDANGAVVGEVTADVGAVTWRVHVANRKAAWYQFLNAMDLSSKYAITAPRRNAAVTGTARKKLIIDPGSRTITGRSIKGTAYKFDSGQFMGKKVPLGEVRTDKDGRLLVLGGFGSSSSYLGKPATTFANNDGWHDDTSDGTVRASVKIGSKTFEAEPAAVVVTPPNYGQGLYGVVTMYDVVYDLFCRTASFKFKPPAKPSFWRHIYPMLARLVGTGWVNSGVDMLFGPGSPSHLTDPDLLAKLSDPGSASAPLRAAYAGWFRDPAGAWGKQQPVKLPPFYGDAFGNYPNLGADDLAVTPTQYGWLKRWAAGDFDANPADRTRPATLGGYALADQPSALDEANLESCLGGPFHPGIELTWPMRVASMWTAPFRLKLLAEGKEPKMDYGATLTPAEVLGTGGVVSSTAPGTLTWWLGVHWQTDEASCLSGYELGTYLPLPSFWAARVPNQVLSERSYEGAMDTTLPDAQRFKHLFYRSGWLRYFSPTNPTRINDNVARWHQLGIVAPQPGPTDLAGDGVPDTLWVETALDPSLTAADATWEQVKLAEHILGLPAGDVVSGDVAGGDVALAGDQLAGDASARADLVDDGLAAEREEIPPAAQRRVLGRGEL